MRRTRSRGFRLVRVFKWVFRSRRRRFNGYERLLGPSDYKSSTMTKFYSWGKSLKRKALGMCCSKSVETLDYCRLGQGGDPFEPRKSVEVPKGHLAVYVGQKDDDPHRILVPIIYFNHPLFGELLREAEKEFGYNHPGRITIPCPISEFERVKMTIAEGRKSIGKFHRDW